MSKVTLFISLTADGVMQAPGRPDEDRRGGFAHGGWATPYADSVLGSVAGGSIGTSGGLLLGRRTYQDFYAVWPNRPKPNPFTDLLNNMQKYVASTTLKEPLPWSNSMLLTDDAATAVARLREQPGKDLVILGSGALAQSLMQRNLIDTYVLLVHPLVLGTGRRLFPADGPNITLQLVDTKTTSTGVVITTYRPAAPSAAR
jgi:dihydrofolate reductase